jgi:hypothetical protein
MLSEQRRPAVDPGQKTEKIARSSRPSTAASPTAAGIFIYSNQGWDEYRAGLRHPRQHRQLAVLTSANFNRRPVSLWFRERRAATRASLKTPAWVLPEPLGAQGDAWPDRHFA